MTYEHLDFNELLKARCHAAKESLRTISVAEVKALTEELFPDGDHPWLELILNIINDPAGGTLYHAMADEYIHLLYSHDKEMGMWFIPEIGKGRLQPKELTAMRDLVEAKP